MLAVVKLHERETLLARIADGDVSLATAFDVGADDVKAIARVGAAALSSGRVDLAERVFAGLAALSDDPVHSLHLACARAARSDVAGALSALDAFLHDARTRTVEDEVEGLLLRAELTGRTDPARALADLARARALEADR